MTRFKYEGPAELLDEDGQLIDSVTVGLYEDTWSGLRSWRGSIEPVGDMAVNWMHARQIKLPSGATANVLVTEVGSLEAGWGGRLVGSGPPPY